METLYKLLVCKKCNGSGLWGDEDWPNLCPECRGKGKYIVDTAELT